jgi:hypothetical protein
VPDQKWFIIIRSDMVDAFMLDFMSCVRVCVMDRTITLAARWQHVVIDQIRPMKDVMSLAGIAL